MSQTDSLRVQHHVHDRQFTVEVSGERATLDYRLSADVMTITHTQVPAAIGGRGVAAALMRAALDHAAASGWSVNPVCSYAAAYMRKNALKQHRHDDRKREEALEESFPASDPPAIGDGRRDS